MSFDNSDDDNPWSRASKEPCEKNSKGPFSLEDFKKKKNKEDTSYRKEPEENLFDNLLKKIRKFSGNPPTPPTGPNSGKAVFIIIPLFLLFLWLGFGFYRVQEGELGVVLRFGKIKNISPPGLRYHFPYPFEQALVRNVSSLNKFESYGSTFKGDSKFTADSSEQTLILTVDENMIHVVYTVLWKIKSLSNFLFKVRDPQKTIQAAAESAIREVIGQSNAKDALTSGRELISTKSQDLLQKMLDVYEAGVEIVSVNLQRVEPPEKVIQAFNDMQASLVDADRVKNEAEAYKSDILPRARGEAFSIVQRAQAYKQRSIEKARGETAHFNSIYKAYKQNSDITSAYLRFKTIKDILSRSNKTLIDSSNIKSIIPYLNLQNQVLNQSNNKEKKPT